MELVLERGRLTIEAVARGDAEEDGGVTLEGFYLLVGEADDHGEPIPGGLTVRIPLEAENARLFCGSVLDYLEKHRVGAHTVAVAGSGELAMLERHRHGKRRP